MFAIADQLEKKSIEKTKLKSQIKMIALMYMKYRQFESLVITSETDRKVCSFFFDRWRKNIKRPLVQQRVDGL